MKTNAVNTSEKIKHNVFGPCRPENAGRKGKSSNGCDAIAYRGLAGLDESFKNDYCCRRLYSMTKFNVILYCY